LSLRQWIRGYSYFVGIARNDDPQTTSRCIRLNEADLVAGLQGTGLSEAQARKFVRLVTFGRNTLDLFDAPLIKVADGSYVFFCAPYRSALIGVIALSRMTVP
jgi:hypothetical protein